MHFQSQLISKLILGTFLMLWAQTTADMLTDEVSLNNLYNNLLQREYAGPVLFPNHQVERKAQRSPSLRLRFGRRSDPDFLPHSLVKRWFGDVDQKPIRSPSRRLRFGRSDPSMPMHSPFDMLMNAQQSPENNDVYNDIYGADYYNRVVRKPQRLRFGRSLPYETNQNQLENDVVDTVGDEVNEMALNNSEDDFYNNLMHSQKLRNLLMSLKQYGNQDNDGLAASSSSSLEEDMDEFERAIRKPAPLRLRWGRSTSVQKSENKSPSVLEQKEKVTEISNDVDKSLNNQNKD